MGKARDALKLVVGRFAEFAFAGLGQEIDEVRNTAHAVQLKRAIVYARVRRAHERGDDAGIDRALAAYWKAGPGDWFYNSLVEARVRLFREQHAVAIDTFARLIDGSSVKFRRLVEIGCGDGRVLAECARRLPRIPEVIGLDINAAAIAHASSSRLTDGRLAFVNAEARTWLKRNPRPGTVVLSNNGVLEYLSQDHVDELLHAIAAAPPAGVVLIEPVAPEHDLQRQPKSFPFGREYSFSHNHRRRLTHAGFDVVFERETHAAQIRLMLMVGLLV